MPTPFTHLAVAGELLNSPALAPDVKAALLAEQPAFLLGNIAPDVQTITGQTREATHFFPVPIDGAPPAERRLFELYPALQRRGALSAGAAAFLSGYLAHLAFDQLWVARIFEPVFGPAQAWESLRERLYLHNVLRAHWDSRDLAQLSASTADRLRQAAPDRWLPFADDRHLSAWRDLVGDQLVSGGSRTVEVFAARMNVEPAAFAALLASPEALQQRVLSRLPPEVLAAYRAAALNRSVAIIQDFWRR